MKWQILMTDKISHSLLVHEIMDGTEDEVKEYVVNDVLPIYGEKYYLSLARIIND